MHAVVACLMVHWLDHLHFKLFVHLGLTMQTLSSLTWNITAGYEYEY